MMPEYVKTSKLLYYNLEDYQTIHYASDHHWNGEGSRRGYENIYEMISKEQELSPMYLPEEKMNFTNLWGIRYRGSYANRLQELYSGSDEFSVYRYTLPKREIYAIEPDTGMEIELDELGLWEEYKSGQFCRDTYADHYVTFYGYGKDEQGK
ncbi:MAG: hypothetical protein HFI33_11660 [Lachnospiraceae bacterium]|nr:hypothetical protein [Lachnospiraceae bacterium]